MTTLSCAPLRGLSPDGRTFSLRSTATAAWPAGRFRTVPDAVSLRLVAHDLAAAAAQLDALSRGVATTWPHLDRAGVVRDLAARLVDPCLVRQHSTQMCGPTAITFFLAWQVPDVYVSLAAQLYATGRATTTTGRVVSPGEGVQGSTPTAGVAEGDWLVIASLRDDENWLVPVGSGTSWLEGLTTPGEMVGWTRDVAGFAGADSQWSWSSGEAHALRLAQKAQQAGVPAFLLIGDHLVLAGSSDNATSFRRTLVDASGAQTTDPYQHSADDDEFPNHWVVYLGGDPVAGATADDDRTTFTFDLWSWGSVYRISTTMEGLSEYLWGVVTGLPA